ncbi:phosphatidylinositol 4-kinase gamma 4-like isoform X1 [Rosa rugosa]|uniref:phosphatidylinositol 4-kinase gamma 4-like isoform X1 n=1 Tax=Rosa rugosa TaxID=74645 RepID=UPI002B40D881|nr:phosphatidylinositol 4-kinase gamma 4-like isoform X1 [Rosa rugosa]
MVFLVKKQKLHGRELATNNSRVRDYVVTDRNQLHLVLGLSDLQVITVRSLSCMLRGVGMSDMYVKQQIAKKGNGSVDVKDRESSDGEELEDQILISKEDASIAGMFGRKLSILLAGEWNQVRALTRKRLFP